jgi:hypothetical protein
VFYKLSKSQLPSADNHAVSVDTASLPPRNNDILLEPSECRKRIHQSDFSVGGELQNADRILF